MKIAIYSRKSKFTDKGDSIENQIEMCKEFAENHFESPEYIIYEDEGFSGGSTNRPRFLQMLKDAKEKKFDVLICYRLDRVSRNIADFTALIEELEKNNISFVSVREQFDTSSPLGKAMMYIASVFAQLERETIAERVRDNMRELAKTGRWLGGAPPLGFELERITILDDEFKERSLVKLSPLPEEMKKVEFLYIKYLELGSVNQLRKYLIQNDIKTKKDAYFSARKLFDILRNPAYVKANEKVIQYLEKKGIIVAGLDRLNGKRAVLIYNKRNRKGLKNDEKEWIGAVAKHEGVIPTEKWLQVQAELDKNSMTLPRLGTSEVALLSGILRCAKCGSAMTVTYGRKRKDGSAPHYYTCNIKIFSSSKKCNNPNAPGTDLDATVINKLLELSASNKEALLEELKALRNEKDKTDVLSELKNRKERLLKEINNLVGEVAKNSVASKYILPQIEERDREVKMIDEKISNLEKEKEEAKKKLEEFEIVASNILNFKDAMERLSNKEKKFFLQTIIDKVFWDGESKEAGIMLLLEGNDELSRFHTAPSRSCNQDHTVSIV